MKAKLLIKKETATANDYGTFIEHVNDFACCYEINGAQGIYDGYEEVLEEFDASDLDKCIDSFAGYGLSWAHPESRNIEEYSIYLQLYDEENDDTLEEYLFYAPKKFGVLKHNEHDCTDINDEIIKVCDSYEEADDALSDILDEIEDEEAEDEDYDYYMRGLISLREAGMTSEEYKEYIKKRLKLNFHII